MKCNKRGGGVDRGEGGVYDATVLNVIVQLKQKRYLNQERMGKA